MFKNPEIIMNLINLIIKEWGIKHTFYVIINKAKLKWIHLVKEMIQKEFS